MAEINIYASVSFNLNDLDLDKEELIEKMENGESVIFDTYIDVDVDLYGVDTEDLIEELEERNISGRNLERIKMLGDGITHTNHETPKTLVDTMIFDLFYEKWHTKTLEDFEKFFD